MEAAITAEPRPQEPQPQPQPYDPNSVYVGGKAYKIKRKLTVGEVRKIRLSNANLLGLNQQIIANATDADLADITKRILEKTTEQDEEIAKIIQSCTGLTDEEINGLEYLDAVLLFNAIYEHSTIIKKN